MTNDNDGLMDRIKDTVSGITDGDEDTTTGSDAVAGAPTDVAGAAKDSSGGVGGAGGDPRFGPSQGGVADILPGGPGPGTDEDDTMTDRLSPDS